MRIFLFLLLNIISFVALFVPKLSAQVRPNYETLLQKKSALNDTITKYYLALDRIGRANRIRFYVGDEIEYRIKDEKFRRKNEILGVTNDGFLIAGGEIKTVWVERIWVKRKYTTSNLPRQAQKLLPPIGLVMLIADLIGEKKITTFGLVGGGMILSGIGLRILNTKRYFIGKNSLLKSIEAI